MRGHWNTFAPRHPKRIRQRVKSAIERCHDPYHAKFGDYGLRGIRVYQEWLNDPRKFADYLMSLEGWDNTNLVLDRIDNEGNYEPGNLRFATHSVSLRNRRRGFNLVEQLCEDGTTERMAEVYRSGATLNEVAEQFGVHFMAVSRCLIWYRAQLSPEQLQSFPKRNDRREK